MAQRDETAQPTRRDLVALAPAAGAAAVLLPAGKASAAPHERPADRRHLPWEETEHIRRAYARMRS